MQSDIVVVDENDNPIGTKRRDFIDHSKDVTFKEDASKIRTKQAPENTSLIRNVAINLFRGAGYTNIAQAIRLVANDIPVLWRLVSA